MQLDTEKLRKDLKEDYEAAMFNGFPMAMMDMSRLERASEQELIQIAQENRVNLNKYIK